MFRSSVRKEDAKRAFGIPEGHKHLVMMCGSMGCGPIMSIARRIGRDLPDDQDLTIVCGTNKQLYRRLQRRFYDAKNVHVRSYVKDMALLMDSADLYLTKPGGISVTEAASMRLPMVFIDAVAGCEEYNKDFFLRTGARSRGRRPKRSRARAFACSATRTRLKRWATRSTPPCRTTPRPTSSPR